MYSAQRRMTFALHTPCETCHVSHAPCLHRTAHEWAVSALASEPTLGLEMMQIMPKPGQRATVILVRRSFAGHRLSTCALYLACLHADLTLRQEYTDTTHARPTHVAGGHA